MSTSADALVVRPATAEDAVEIVRLVLHLGHRIDAAGARRRIEELKLAGLPQLVATKGGQVIGFCGIHRITAVHRNAPVGRVTILIVDQNERGTGVGRQLLETAERHLRRDGCHLLEITSNDLLVDAHRFYEHLGYERTSNRFAKKLS